MKKLGYVKLSSYGLVLTPEGRVLSMRPAALDDGLGHRIVGWQDGDLAAMELDKWEPARPAPKAAVATRVAASPPQLPTRPFSAAPSAIPGMVVRETSLPITVAQVPTIKQPAPAPMTARAPIVAPEPVVEEDDWEWTIAIARARAAADEAELAAAAPPPPAPKWIPAKTLPLAKVAAMKPDPIQDDAWPKTEPLGELDYNDYASPMAEVVRVVRLANTPRVVMPAKATPPKAMPVVVPVVAAPVPAQAREYPRAKSPVTVIPVPKLPNISSSASTPRALHIAPVVRTSAAPIAPPRRIAKGTGPYLPKTAPMAVVAAPRRDDDTVPGIVLPPISRTISPSVSLPSIVKRAQRG
ncbi:MAG: hypothetical protein IPQ07_19770 [Myxococcales bacterium]|nr:hypothetical protein [Myxococcales bacterium]